MTRDKAIDVLDKLPFCEGCDGTFPYNCDDCGDAFLLAIEALKQPEIVQCKNCEFRNNHGATSSQWLPCVEDVRLPDDFFCARGRKAGENNGTDDHKHDA